jgi:hypothetical protein
MRRSSLSSPRDDRPSALVKTIERNLREDLHRGDWRRSLACRRRAAVDSAAARERQSA